MPYFTYVSLEGDDQILVFAMDAETGKLTRKEAAPVSGGPGDLAVDPERKFLFAGRGKARDIASFSIDQATGGITQTGSAPVKGEYLALATDRNGRYLLSASYDQGTAEVHRIENGAAVHPPIQSIVTAPTAHCIQTDPSNRFAFVAHTADPGPNRIYQFLFDENTGHLTPNTPPQVEPPGYLGPRDFCFHPFMDTVYFSDEQGRSVSAYRLDTAAGTLAAFQTISTLPPDYTGYSSCSQVQITPSGRFLYAPNRGHNSIAGFSVDPSDGTLSAAGLTPAQAVPRAFSLDPRGKFLYAAGLHTGDLTCFGIDQDTGELTPLEVYPVGNRPSWVLTIELGS